MKGKNIKGVWMTSREPLSLGGLLVLRQELEMLAASQGASDLELTIDGPGSKSVISEDGLPHQVFQSFWPVQITAGPGSEEAWPPLPERESPEFSYMSMSRVIRLWRESGMKPVLRWSPVADTIRPDFKGRLYTLHLKQVGEGRAEESNASPGEWESFLKKQASPGKRNFVLLGNDPVPPEIRAIPGVYVARDLGLSLVSQLRLVSRSDGFLGMASGICQAAIFSDVPYAILKHPLQHSEAMRKEVGEANHFPFARGPQYFLRRKDEAGLLGEALAAIENHVSV